MSKTTTEKNFKDSLSQTIEQVLLERIKLVGENDQLYTGYPNQLIKELVAAITSAHRTEVERIIGEDEKPEWDREIGFCERCSFQPSDDTRQCICYYRNQLRAEMRERL